MGEALITRRGGGSLPKLDNELSCVSTEDIKKGEPVEFICSAAKKNNAGDRVLPTVYRYSSTKYFTLSDGRVLALYMTDSSSYAVSILDIDESLDISVIKTLVIGNIQFSSAIFDNDELYFAGYSSGLGKVTVNVSTDTLSLTAYNGPENPEESGALSLASISKVTDSVLLVLINIYGSKKYHVYLCLYDLTTDSLLKQLALVSDNGGTNAASYIARTDKKSYTYNVAYYDYTERVAAVVVGENLDSITVYNATDASYIYSNWAIPTEVDCILRSVAPLGGECAVSYWKVLIDKSIYLADGNISATNLNKAGVPYIGYTSVLDVKRIAENLWVQFCKTGNNGFISLVYYKGRVLHTLQGGEALNCNTTNLTDSNLWAGMLFKRNNKIYAVHACKQSDGSVVSGYAYTVEIKAAKAKSVIHGYAKKDSAKNSVGNYYLL